ncbi:hypothetical protein CHS0354_040487 [Potamilus streckersoni]|uniref:Uncharacterized protein n=1 Tax=Potamilus streckersoni TaxID=2493646 RepID=A0AAE0TK51_9BIVA|nr:hypothetical protein CHS0354_040487 [Potamilus streckersoni]
MKVVEHHGTKTTLPSSDRIFLNQSTEPEERIYDYPDLSQMDLYIDKKPVAHVSPPSKTDSHQKHSNKTFTNLTVPELYERLKLCGFEQLSKVCDNQKIDGMFMFGLEETLLVKSPFNLTQFQFYT